MFRKVLIANRGEIAVRVARACRELGVRSVGVHSTADRDAAVLSYFDETVSIGPAAAKRSYLNVPAVIEAALQTGADAIHPGYGFLSEDPDFAEICAENDMTFIGPRPAVMAALGDKSSARRLMEEAGLPLLPGCVEPVETPAEAHRFACSIGYPVIIKGVAGGGGRGMRIVWSAAELTEAYLDVRAVALGLFGNDQVYLERYLATARHVEVQVLCDAHGQGVHLGTRDCTVQRRHQKLVEEAPAPALDHATTDAMAASAVRAMLAAGFTGVGTMEFLVDSEERHYFMEINPRIQVEHPVSEMITGRDLVQEQILAAAGARLQFGQDDVEMRGCSIECRVNGEDPERGFAPTPGRLTTFVPPGGPFTRVDTHAYPGYELGPHYDSLLAKVVVWAPDRERALNRMDRALAEFRIDGAGVRTTIPFLRTVLADTEFRKAQHSTGIVERLVEADPEHPGSGR